MIANLKEGESSRDVFLCIRKEEGTTKTGSAYLSLELGDKSGTITGKIWDIDSVCEFKVGDFLRASYTVSLYKNQKQIIISDCEQVEVDNPEEYLRSSVYDIGSMCGHVRDMLGQISDPWLGRLVNAYLGKGLVEELGRRPAAVKVHHAFVGGLLEHTLFVMRSCRAIAKNYDTIVNLDLVVAAAFLHDIGKLKEIDGQFAYDYSKEGSLFGHLVLSAFSVKEHCALIEGFPKELEQDLIHCILGHHGKQEWGSPVVPLTAEALILHFCDNLDAKLAILKEGLNGNASTYNKYLGGVPYKGYEVK